MERSWSSTCCKCFSISHNYDRVLHSCARLSFGVGSGALPHWLSVSRQGAAAVSKRIRLIVSVLSAANFPISLCYNFSGPLQHSVNAGIVAHYGRSPERKSSWFNMQPKEIFVPSSQTNRLTQI